MISVESIMKLANRKEGTLREAKKSKEDSPCSRERNVDTWVGTMLLFIKWARKNMGKEEKAEYFHLTSTLQHRFPRHESPVSCFVEVDVITNCPLKAPPVYLYLAYA